MIVLMAHGLLTMRIAMSAKTVVMMSVDNLPIGHVVGAENPRAPGQNKNVIRA